MGSYDGAETWHLVSLYLLDKMKDLGIERNLSMLVIIRPPFVGVIYKIFARKWQGTEWLFGGQESHREPPPGASLWGMPDSISFACQKAVEIPFRRQKFIYTNINNISENQMYHNEQIHRNADLQARLVEVNQATF